MSFNQAGEDAAGPVELSSAMHFTEQECVPQTLASPAAPNHGNIPPGRKTPPHYTGHFTERRSIKCVIQSKYKLQQALFS